MRTVMFFVFVFFCFSFCFVLSFCPGFPLGLFFCFVLFHFVAVAAAAAAATAAAGDCRCFVVVFNLISLADNAMLFTETGRALTRPPRLIETLTR